MEVHSVYDYLEVHESVDDTFVVHRSSTYFCFYCTTVHAYIVAIDNGIIAYIVFTFASLLLQAKVISR